MSDWKDKVQNRRGFAPHHTSGKTAVVDKDGVLWLEDPKNPGEPIRVGENGGGSRNELDLPADDSLAIKVDRAAAGAGKPGTKFDAPETEIRAKATPPMPRRGATSDAMPKRKKK